MAKITQHPKVTPQRVKDLADLARRIDVQEKDRIIAEGREFFARHDRIKAAISKLRDARLKHRLTLEQVAKRTGIGKANLSRLENDQAPNPTLDTLLRVADAVGCEILK